METWDIKLKKFPRTYKEKIEKREINVGNLMAGLFSERKSKQKDIIKEREDSSSEVQAWIFKLEDFTEKLSRMITNVDGKSTICQPPATMRISVLTVLRGTHGMYPWVRTREIISPKVTQLGGDRQHLGPGSIIHFCF